VIASLLAVLVTLFSSESHHVTTGAFSPTGRHVDAVAAPVDQTVPNHSIIPHTGGPTTGHPLPG